MTPISDNVLPLGDLPKDPPSKKDPTYSPQFVINSANQCLNEYRLSWLLHYQRLINAGYLDPASVGMDLEKEIHEIREKLSKKDGK